MMGNDILVGGLEQFRLTDGSQAQWEASPHSSAPEALYKI